MNCVPLFHMLKVDFSMLAVRMFVWRFKEKMDWLEPGTMGLAGSYTLSQATEDFSNL